MLGAVVGGRTRRGNEWLKSALSQATWLQSLLGPSFFGPEIVCYRESTRHPTGLHVGEIAVHLIRYDAFERDIAVLHDNVNWRHGLMSIPVQRRRAIDCAESREPNTIIEGRERQNMNFILPRQRNLWVTDIAEWCREARFVSGEPAAG